MKFELFDRGVFQPIEFILGFLYIGIIVTFVCCLLQTLHIYFPWWTETETVEISHGMLVVIGLWVWSK